MITYKYKTMEQLKEAMDDLESKTITCLEVGLNEDKVKEGYISYRNEILADSPFQLCTCDACKKSGEPGIDFRLKGRKNVDWN